MLTEVVKLPEPVMMINLGQAADSAVSSFPGHHEKLPSSSAPAVPRAPRW